ncbi:aldo/keto reductase [Brachyspira hampsonii]|uniref:aldo/keto reductase n=1 Tax=Brachyspira hampsonii TaxID=1287055 RepID=UPI000D366274|nr:aldo/keto reductase [Brachyspira hampsonii]PTY40052.1 aldo/keto reductase [Brachyspira hampsonii bv. II]
MNYTLKSSNIMPKFGIGTWCMGEVETEFKKESESIAFALENGVRLIDTAEMYGEGKAESIIGDALKISNIKREELFIVSKVYPHNAGRDKLFKSLEASLNRMGLKYLDMYLLHWRGRVPLSETVECMEEAKRGGLIKDWGVSNFDIDDMKELETIKDGDKCTVNQVLYHLGSRGVDYSLAPYMEERNIALMAYCPLAQAGNLGKDILKNNTILSIAKKHNAAPSQIALSFIMGFNNKIAIPKSSNKKHIIENIESQKIKLDDEDMAIINKEFPKPNRKMPLDIV